MISMKCARCGRAIEVSDFMLGMEIPCARCGQLLTPAVAPDAANTAIGTSPLQDLEEEEDLSDVDETVTPIPTRRADTSYSFLAPAREPGELGWLGHYRVLSLLGQGAMGTVFRAVDTQLQRSIALKVMKPELAQDEMSRARFLREARAMASIKSDHIVAVYQVGQTKHIPFLAMEFLPGESLDKRLERPERLSLDELLRLGAEIARGLAAAHERGLIHRDIKPSNIWLELKPEARPADSEKPRDPGGASGANPPGGGDSPAAHLPVTLTPGMDAGADCRVKILDFGLVRQTRECSNLTEVGMVMGTPAYISPEQIEGKVIDARCDLFSLGCMLYEMATGQQPFTGANSVVTLMAVASKDPLPPQQLNPALPPRLTELILQLLAKDPNKRPASAREVLDRLKAIADARSMPAPPPPPEPAPVPAAAAPIPPATPRRSWPVIGLAVLGCLLTVGLLVWGLYSLLASSQP